MIHHSIMDQKWSGKMTLDKVLVHPGKSGSGYTLLRDEGYAGNEVNAGKGRAMANSGRSGAVAMNEGGTVIPPHVAPSYIEKP